MQFHCVPSILKSAKSSTASSFPPVPLGMLDDMSTWKSLQDVLEDRAQLPQPGRLLFYPLGNVSKPVEVTYTSLYQRAKSIGRNIQRLENFNLGRLVLLHFDDHCDLILWFWAVLFAGGLPVPSSPFSLIEEDRQKHIKTLSAILESPICFTRSRLMSLFGVDHDMHLYAVESLAKTLETASPHSGSLGTKDKECGYEENLNGSSHDLQYNEPTESRLSGDPRRIEYGNLLMLMLTSGSTGNAKAAPFTHEQVLTAVAGKTRLRELPRNRPFLNWIGLDHVAGLIEIHFQALWLGVDQVHVNAADVVTSPKVFLDMLSRHHVSLTFAPNFFLARLVSAESRLLRESKELDLSSLVCVTSGGEANDIKTCIGVSDLFAYYGAPRNIINVGFGMTETCAGSIYNTNCPEYDISCGNTVAAVGRCIEGIRMRITTSEGQAAELGEPGDLEVCGPVVFKGYYRNPTATEQAFTPDHWFRTGDRGFIDAGGNLNLVGRVKEVININGVKIIAADIHTAIEGLLGDRVTRVVVFPSFAQHTEQVTVAYTPSGASRDEDLMEIDRLVTKACLLRTATKPLVFALQELSTSLLPISTLGKVSRFKMARLFAEGKFALDLELHQQAVLRASNVVRQAHADLKGPKSATEAFLLEKIADVLGAPPDVLDVSPDTSLFDLGFTSMHFVKLKHVLDHHFELEIPIVLVINNPTVTTLAASIESHMRRSRLNVDQPPFSTTYDPVVVLRAEGSKAPLWLVHPGVGEVLVFMGLAQCLTPDDRPVYALRAAGFEPPYQRFESIEQTVAMYTAAIRQRQPHGPYALAGYSYGTMLAFEVAKRLEAYGHDVGFLGSLNLPPHIKQRMRMLEWNVCLLNLGHFLGLISEHTSNLVEADRAYRNLSRTQAMATLLKLASKPRWKELNLKEDFLARWADVAFGLQRMASDYDPSGQVKHIDVFYCTPLKAVAESREVWRREHLSRWADFAHEAPRFHSVLGAHYTMIDSEHVAGFAQTLMAALEARGI